MHQTPGGKASLTFLLGAPESTAIRCRPPAEGSTGAACNWQQNHEKTSFGIQGHVPAHGQLDQSTDRMSLHQPSTPIALSPTIIPPQTTIRVGLREGKGTAALPHRRIALHRTLSLPCQTSAKATRLDHQRFVASFYVHATSFMSCIFTAQWLSTLTGRGISLLHLPSG